MLLVFLFFIIVIITTQLRLCINAKDNKFNVFLEICIFGFICVGKVSLNKLKTKYGRALNQKMKNNVRKSKTIKLFFKFIKVFPGRIKEFKAKINVCVADAALTAYAVAIISSIISLVPGIFNNKIKSNNISYKVIPVYENEIMINIDFKCIITANLVHTITVIYTCIKEWRREDNGRKSSNRKSYGNCYE